MIKMEGGQEAICVKRFLLWLVKSFDSQSEKSEMWKKSNDKTRFILIKEIVEKNEIVDISKRDNVPSTVDVLRAGKIKQTADELEKNDLVNIQASNSVYVGGPPCWLKNIS